MREQANATRHRSSSCSGEGLEQQGGGLLMAAKPPTRPRRSFLALLVSVCAAALTLGVLTGAPHTETSTSVRSGGWGPMQ